MASKRKARKQEVSLFPFLDILACVIGNLILIITTVVLEQVDTKPVAEAAHLEEIRDEAAKALADVRTMQQQLAELQKKQDGSDKRIEEARRQIAEAEKRRRELAERIKPLPPPDAKLAVEQKRLEEEKKEAVDDIKRIEFDIAERKKKLEQSIVVLPAGAAGGGEQPKKAVFVEVDADGVIVHEGEQPWRVATAAIGTDAKFKQLLVSINDDEDSIITFMVRPAGIAVYRQADQAVKAAGARAGKVPLPGTGTLDLSKAK
jgi:hypothetical protein